MLFNSLIPESPGADQKARRLWCEIGKKINVSFSRAIERGKEDYVVVMQTVVLL